VVTRREFLAAGVPLVAGAPLIACSRKTDPPLPPGTLSGADFGVGHRLRQPDFPAPSETRRVPVLVVGAGIGGLSAGWRLRRAGFGDFTILDLESAPGGNARGGENAVSRHPLGAHYLPLPTRESFWVRELLADFGAIEGDAHIERPRYDERLLCHSPQERVYRDGVWEEGLLPRIGASQAERDQFARFHALMAEFKEATDLDGRRAFALPVAQASRDLRWLGLDRMTMAEWLIANRFDSERLHWYVNYACRDDYGTDYREASAWAGIHYFACRTGLAANAASDAVLTAPEGNGWIVARLAQGLAGHVQTGALAHRLRQDKREVGVDVWLEAERRSVRYIAEHVVWAAPLFVLPRVAEALPAPIAAVAAAGGYAPWVVANLTLSEAPAHGVGAPLSWDNVLYGADGLGYVVATHQNVRVAPGATVLTYYRAFADRPPREARELMLATSREAWAEAILAELSRAHGDLRRLTLRLDVHRHAHAMIRPLPGVIHDEARRTLVKGWNRVVFAHADLSGLSLFEEANYHGIGAAAAILGKLGGKTSAKRT
jgi:monoamine oxidase